MIDRMPEPEPEEMIVVEFVISEYTDAQAQEDGVLVALPHKGIHNRVTAAVWADYVYESNFLIPLTDITPLVALWDKVAAVPVKADWHIAEVDGKTFWMVPNELGGLTLMYPEDY